MQLAAMAVVTLLASSAHIAAGALKCDVFRRFDEPLADRLIGLAIAHDCDEVVRASDPTSRRNVVYGPNLS